MVPGMTANVISTSNPGVNANNWAMNLDGQAVGNKTSQGLGQPKFSREAIAEYQIVTNLYDVTQGGSTGVQLQAITKSGTNSLSGSGYGFFRDDKLNAADAVSKTVLPYHDDQWGATLGGPIVKDKLHYFFVLRVRADAVDDLQHGPGARAEHHDPEHAADQVAAAARGRSADDERPPVGSRHVVDLRRPVLPVVAEQHAPVAGLGRDAGLVQRPRHLVEGGQHVGGAGNQGRAEALLVRLRAAHHRHGVSRARVSRSDGRSGELDAAVARAGLRVGPLRPEPAPRVARLQARRRVHQRPDVGRLPRPRPRPDDVHVAAARHRHAHPGLGGHEPGGVESDRPQPDRAALQHQLPEDQTSSG